MKIHSDRVTEESGEEESEKNAVYIYVHYYNIQRVVNEL